MSRHRVVTFARYAELLGGAEVEVELAARPTVADLITALRSLPGGGSLPASPIVAINLAVARPDTAIGPDDELALLPPLAGG